MPASRVGFARERASTELFTAIANDTIRQRPERHAHPPRKRSTAQRNALGNAQNVTRIRPVPRFGAKRNFPNENPPPGNDF